MTFYIHKFEVRLEYGGPEEGGWWFQAGDPVDGWVPESFSTEEAAYEKCAELNDAEQIRRHDEEEYSYHSVLASRSTHYTFSVSDSPVAKSYPENQPHYE